jgi:hypothetical protein
MHRLRAIWNEIGLNDQYELTDDDFNAKGKFKERSPALRMYNQALRISGRGGADPADRNQEIVNRIDRERREAGFGNGHVSGSGKPHLTGAGCSSESEGEMDGSGKRKHSGSSGEPPAKKPWLIKGSQAAKDRMKQLREMRGKKK